ncbi:hypothetical protein J15TS10_15540 [Paenibacillus woosongensis]|uniref:Secreted protein n=1 Tax=Paenibacillus woosongensis TaxID=307580 RepID=A0ABQ4MP13_9BACL|nr:hypothetical protein J15TS10_15540 [Paenibacillus woosongensis]
MSDVRLVRVVRVVRVVCVVCVVCGVCGVCGVCSCEVSDIVGEGPNAKKSRIHFPHGPFIELESFFPIN